MQPINVPEGLVEKCFGRRPDLVTASLFAHNSRPDKDGIDFLVCFKFKDSEGVPRYFPLAMLLQVKTSDDAETVGVVLPLREPISEKLAKRLTFRKMERIRKHQAIQPHVSCILFVGRQENGKKEAAILEEIWREIKKMKDFIKRHRFQYFR